MKQRLEKYSERFDNDKSAIGNPKTWGKRMVDEKESQNLKNFKKLVSDEVSPAMKEFIKEKETLEEAAANYVENFAMSVKSAREIGFIDGAKWQQERSYSEEEVYHILCEHTAFLFAGGKSTLTDWFETVKKK